MTMTMTLTMTMKMKMKMMMKMLMAMTRVTLQFITDAIDNSHKFTASVNDTGDKTLYLNICEHFKQNSKWLYPGNQALTGT